jgi:hypothetical protein
MVAPGERLPDSAQSRSETAFRTQTLIFPVGFTVEGPGFTFSKRDFSNRDRLEGQLKNGYSRVARHLLLARRRYECDGTI